jgi:hypothetical protein
VASGGPCPSWLSYPQVQFQGGAEGDLAVLPNKTMQQCETECDAKHPDCYAVVLVTTTTDSTGTCYLKKKNITNTPPIVFKRLPGAPLTCPDWIEIKDMFTPNPNVSSTDGLELKQCLTQCTQSSDCIAYSFTPLNGRCRLIKADPAATNVVASIPARSQTTG